MNNFWKKCSVCKKEIQFRSKFYECSVSTCTGKRTGLTFCSVPCFERHLPGARHKDAAAIEGQSPSKAHVIHSAPQVPQRRIIRSSPATGSLAAKSLGQASSTEILVVVSKLKKYVQDRGGMNTSQSVMSVLSDKLRRLCDEAIQEAEQDGRKTIMDRDFKK